MSRAFTMRGRYVESSETGSHTTQRRCDGHARFATAPEAGASCWRWEPADVTCTGDENADPLKDDADAHVVCRDGPRTWRMQRPAFFFAGDCAVSGSLEDLKIECSWRCRHEECEGRATYRFNAR
jgi:hypothetical protein